jgi:hypothetical protein
MGNVIHVVFRKATEPDLERFIASQLSGDLQKVLGYERPDIADLIAGDYTKSLHRVRDLFACSIAFESNDIPIEHAEITQHVLEAAARAVATELDVIRNEIAIEIGMLAHSVMLDTARNLHR